MARKPTIVFRIDETTDGFRTLSIFDRKSRHEFFTARVPSSDYSDDAWYAYAVAQTKQIIAEERNNAL